MGNKTIRELRELGVSRDDIEIAKQTQAAQRRTGAPVQSIGVIVGAVKARPKHNPNPPVSLTDRAMRKRGTYDQAALLLDQQALQETNTDRAMKARELSKGAKELSASGQLEFDFFGVGNMSIGHDYHKAITQRLLDSGKTPAQQHRAVAVLFQVMGNLAWQSYECTKTAADLCNLTGIKESHIADTLKLLEQVGAIRRVKRGRTKVITVTPEGAYRGNIHHHAQTVEQYKLDVIDVTD